MLNKLRNKLGYSVYQPLYYTQNLQECYSGTSLCAGSLTGKNAIVTGGGSGIGLAVAQRLVAEGCNVIITGRNEKKLMDAVALVNRNREQIHYIVWNQTDFENMNVKLTQAIAMLPGEKIDILINNAGVYTNVDRSHRFRNVTEDEYDTVMETNLKSTYLLSGKVADIMTQLETGGHIVNISSICASFRSFMYSPYGISKAGIIALTKELSKKYWNAGIVVNGIAPGSVATAMGNLKINDNIAKGCNVLNRTVMPEEIAGLVAFLASDFGRYLNGQIITASASEVL